MPRLEVSSFPYEHFSLIRQIEVKESIVHIRNPRLLEEFRHEQLTARVPTFYGGYRALTFQVADLEKTRSSLAHPFTNLQLRSHDKNGSSYRDLFVDWDELKQLRPRVWYAMHCLIPWSKPN
jgi:hypothetical protein